MLTHTLVLLISDRVGVPRDKHRRPPGLSLTVPTAKALIAARVSSVIECNADTLDGAKLCDVLRALGISTWFVDDDPTTVKLKCTWLTALDKVDNPSLCCTHSFWLTALDKVDDPSLCCTHSFWMYA